MEDEFRAGNTLTVVFQQRLVVVDSHYDFTPENVAVCAYWNQNTSFSQRMFTYVTEVNQVLLEKTCNEDEALLRTIRKHVPKPKPKAAPASGTPVRSQATAPKPKAKPAPKPKAKAKSRSAKAMMRPRARDIPAPTGSDLAQGGGTTEPVGSTSRRVSVETPLEEFVDSVSVNGDPEASLEEETSVEDLSLETLLSSDSDYMLPKRRQRGAPDSVPVMHSMRVRTRRMCTVENSRPCATGSGPQDSLCGEPEEEPRELLNETCLPPDEPHEPRVEAHEPQDES